MKLVSQVKRADKVPIAIVALFKFYINYYLYLKSHRFECWHPYYVTTHRGASRTLWHFFLDINDIFLTKRDMTIDSLAKNSHMLSLHGAKCNFATGYSSLTCYLTHKIPCYKRHINYLFMIMNNTVGWRSRSQVSLK